MKLCVNQKVIVRKNRDPLSEQKLSLSERINQYQFTGEVLSINENTIEVCKLTAQSLYGKGDEKDILVFNTHSEEYDIQPLRTEACFQSEPRAIGIF